MNGSTKHLTLERLTKDHIHVIRALQGHVKASLDDPDLLVELTEEEIDRITGEESGLAVGVMNTAEELVGLHAVLYPGPEENLGRSLNMPEETLDEIFHLEISFIHPAYRGKALMVTMCQWLLDQVALEGRYRYACATISPYNIGSVKNTMLSGNAVVDMQEKYGGLERYILFQDLEQPAQYDEPQTRFVEIGDDPLAPVTWLKAGYHGVAIEKKEDKTVMVMKKPL